ncbi:MAG: hypothetical protein MZV65_00275 [Chromatiales bacterium]|nr:hypothetical protein [Chromatiales bacterium]
MGFIAEDVPDLVATKDRKGLSPMDIVAVMTKVVQEQQGMIEKQQEIIEKLNARLDDLEEAPAIRRARRERMFESSSTTGGRKMKRFRIVFITVLFVVAFSAVALATTRLHVIRKADNSMCVMTCDGTVCSACTAITGGFSNQPTVIWDDSIRRFVLMGVGNNGITVWRRLFFANGTPDGDWLNIMSGVVPGAYLAGRLGRQGHNALLYESPRRHDHKFHRAGHLPEFRVRDDHDARRRHDCGRCRCGSPDSAHQQQRGRRSRFYLGTTANECDIMGICGTNPPLPCQNQTGAIYRVPAQMPAADFLRPCTSSGGSTTWHQAPTLTT